MRPPPGFDPVPFEPTSCNVCSMYNVVCVKVNNVKRRTTESMHLRNADASIMIVLLNIECNKTHSYLIYNFFTC